MKRFLVGAFLALASLVGLVPDALAQATWSYDFSNNTARATYPGIVRAPMLLNAPCLSTGADGTFAVGSCLSSSSSVQVFSIFNYGAICDGSHAAADTAAIQAAINAAEAAGTVQNGAGGAAGELYAPGGYNCTINASLNFHKPIDVDFRSFIGYTPTTGSALIFQVAAPTAGQNQGWNIYFAGLRSINGNLSQPTGINVSGTTGVEIRNMQFSNFAIGEVIAFTNVGFYCNASDSAYTGQTIQDNTFYLGQIAFNGQGFYGLSANGNDSCGANTVNIDNTFSNWVNLQLDNSSVNPATTSNTFNITAMDAPASGGTASQIWSDFNIFNIGFLDHPFNLNSAAQNNLVNVVNTAATGCSFTDAGVNNRKLCGRMPEWLVVSKSADQNIISSTTLTNDSALSFQMVANTKYRIRLSVMVFTTSATAGWKFGFTGPASPTVIDSAYSVENSTTPSSATAEALQSGAFILDGTHPLLLTVDMTVQNGVNSGTFQFQWSQNTSTATNVTVRAGSYLEYAID